MRKSDKTKNIIKANLLIEQRFVENNSLTRLYENKNIEFNIARLLTKALESTDGWEESGDGESMQLKKRLSSVITIELNIYTGVKRYSHVSDYDYIFVSGEQYKLKTIFVYLEEAIKAKFIKFINDTIFDVDLGDQGDPYSYYGVSKKDFM